VKTVFKRLPSLQKKTCPVITVAGTNGKGSCVAGLEAIYAEAHFNVGVFTTPILFSHHEQVRINRQLAEDADFCSAFSEVEQGRLDVLLTPFEYHTLVALILLSRKPLDVWILEVGLGGRLDAVNVIDADVAIITTIALDHMEWLGNTRNAIASEKAGIFREQQLAVCGDFYPPSTLLESANKHNIHLY